MTPAALAALRQQDRVTFPALLHALGKMKFTGRTYIDWSQGTPCGLEIPGEPVRIKLDNGLTTRDS